MNHSYLSGFLGHLYGHVIRGNDLNSGISLKRSVGYVPEPVLLSSILILSFPKTSLNVISLPYRSNKRTSPNKIVARPQPER